MSSKSKTFKPSGAVQSWTAPQYILGHSLSVHVVGAAGGDGQGAGHPGGGGGVAHAAFYCNPGDAFDLYVGQAGATSGGGWGYRSGGTGGFGSGGTLPASFGGGGGGSSAVVYDPAGANLLIAVGGGGGGGGSGAYGKNVYGLWFGQGGGGGEDAQEGMPGGGDNPGGQGTTSAHGAAGGGPSYGQQPGGDPSGTTGGSGGVGAAIGVGGSGGGGGGGYGANSGYGGGGGGSGSGPSGGGGGAGGKSFLDGTTAKPYFNDGSNLVSVDALGNETGDGSITLSWLEADAPQAPTINSPATNASVDLWGSGLTVDWTYTPNDDSGDQTHYALRLLDMFGNAYWWDGAALQTIETWVATATQSATIPAATIPNAGLYALAVATKESHYNIAGSYSVDQLIVTPTGPTAVLTSPVGVIHNLPVTAQWTHQVSGAQTAYRVLLYAAATANASNFEPGVTTALEDSMLTTSAATSHAFSYSSFVTGHAYMVFLQITQTDGDTSPWTSSVFIAADPTPNAPALVVIDDGGGSARVIVVGRDSDDFITTTKTTINYSTDGGATWTAVVTDSPITTPSQLFVATDATGVAAGKLWRAKIISAEATVGPWTVTSSVLSGTDDSIPTLTDPSIDGSTIPVWISKYAAAKRDLNQGVFAGLGDSQEFVVSDVRRLRSGEVSLLTSCQAQEDVLNFGYLSPPRALVLSRPNHDPSISDAEVITLIPTGPVTEDKPIPKHRTRWRTLDFTFVEQNPS